MALGTLLKMLSLFWAYIKEQDKANNLKANAIPSQRLLSSINKEFSPLCQLKIKSKIALYDMIKEQYVSYVESTKFLYWILGLLLSNFNLRHLIESIMCILNDAFMLGLHLSNCFKVSLFQEAWLVKFRKHF